MRDKIMELRNHYDALLSVLQDYGVEQYNLLPQEIKPKTQPGFNSFREFTFEERDLEFAELGAQLCRHVIWTLDRMYYDWDAIYAVCKWSRLNEASVVQRASMGQAVKFTRLLDVADFLYLIQYEFYCMSDIDVPFDLGRMSFCITELKQKLNDSVWRDREYFIEKIIPYRIFRAHQRNIDFESLSKINMPVVASINFDRLKNFDVDKLNEHMEKGDYLFGRKQEAETKLLEQLNKLDEHQKTVEKYSSSYGFISLSYAFSDMLKEKREELLPQQKWADRFSVALVSVPVIFVIILLIGSGGLSIEGLKPFLKIGDGFSGLDSLKFFIPILSIELILLYFYRIKLHQVKSLSAQILQLKYRLSLCQFIQDYAIYSKGLHDESPGLLEKFESVIFSPVVANEGDIPATFDGLAQLVDLFGGKK